MERDASLSLIHIYNYDFIPDIKDYDDLGRYYFFEGGYNIDNKFGSFVDFIDCAVFTVPFNASNV